MIETPTAFAPYATKMQDAGLPQIAIDTFRHYYQRLRDGETGLIGEASIDPVGTLPDAEALTGTQEAGRAALSKAVVLKLNGGLGTSMGMTRAKSLLPLRDGLTFLDIIARQVLHLRKEYDCALPLVLMNSFRTRDDTLEALEAYGELKGDLALDFLQHKVPRILADGLAPVTWPEDSTAEWCPPGHGDLYTALVTSGMLKDLLDRGFQYAFVSNSDNLGATLDLDILGWFAQQGAPFLMEVCDRTEADRKGGHLARRKEDGQLLLRESAQCPDDESEAFGDTERYRYFNTNNLWIDLTALNKVLEAHDHVIPLPMIRNEKTVDPRDPSTPACYQLETAMGAALSVFEGAQALRVARHRFAPVKTTGDLLALRSDAFAVAEDWRVVPAEGAIRDRVIKLDARYKTVDAMEERFPHGSPSLARCSRLTVKGDVYFGRDMTLEGAVSVEHDGDQPLVLGDGEVLRGT